MGLLYGGSGTMPGSIPPHGGLPPSTGLSLWHESERRIMMMKHERTIFIMIFFMTNLQMKNTMLSKDICPENCFS
jgi:hypothetical protein